MSGRLLENRVILITGATGALGSVAARAAADAGATVVLLGRKVRRLEALYDALKARGAAEPALYPLDLAGAGEDDYAELTATLQRELGGLHGLIHAAAELGHLAPLAQVEAVRWQRQLQVNLTAPFLLTRAVLELMRASGGGRVIFVGDSAVAEGKPFWGGYGIAKLGLASLATLFNAEAGSFGLHAEVYTPGPMRSPVRLCAYPGEELDCLPSPDTHAEPLLRLLAPATPR